MPCLDVHIGTIEEHQLRANHRHHRKTEVFLTWGARTHWRVRGPRRSKPLRPVPCCAIPRWTPTPRPVACRAFPCCAIPCRAPAPCQPCWTPSRAVPRLPVLRQAMLDPVPCRAAPSRSAPSRAGPCACRACCRDLNLCPNHHVPLFDRLCVVFPSSIVCVFRAV